MTAWPRQTMREVAPLVRRPVSVAPDGTYREIGIRSFAKGVFHKTPTIGIEIGKKRVFSIQPGDLLFNVVFAWEGAVAIASETEHGTIGSHRFLTCVVNHDLADARYLFWWFSRGEGRDQLLRASPGGAGRNRILGIDKLGAIEVPLPPLKEQRRIVARIEMLAAKVETATASRNAAGTQLEAFGRNVRSTLLERLTVDGEFRSALTSPPRNGWSPNCDNQQSGMPVLTLSAVTGWSFNPKAFKRTSQPTRPSAHYWASQGDLLIARSNTPELVGHAAIHTGTPSPCIYPDLMMKLPINHDAVDTKFVWHWLQTRAVRDYIRRSAKGTSPTMKKISQEIVSRIPFPLGVALPDQRRIVAELDALQTKIDAVKAVQSETAAKLNAMLPAILDRAFKGEL